jgi:hypothetical protein
MVDLSRREMIQELTNLYKAEVITFLKSNLFLRVFHQRIALVSQIRQSRYLPVDAS